MEKVALYLRVSTQGQSTDNQRRQLRKLAKLREWEIVETYEDLGISGAKGRDQRPALNELMKAATRREFDRVLVWSADRLGRSTAHVAAIMAELDDMGIKQFYHKEAIDTSTHHGRAMIQMAAVFAELERGMIQERGKAGLERARARGKRLGRPGLAETKKKQVLKAHKQGLSLRQIAKRTGVSVGAAQKIVAMQ